MVLETRNMGTDNVASILFETARCMPVYGTTPDGSSTAAGPAAAAGFLGCARKAMREKGAR